MVSKQKKYSYQLQKPRTDALDLSRKWLLLGINSLALAGFFSILLVMARTPGIQDIMPWKDFFHTSLVIHVDLSVLVWLLSFSCVIWVYGANAPKGLNCRTAYYTSLAGMIAIAISPFSGEGKPLMNNYIPILQNKMFFFGLALFMAGIFVQLIFSFIAFLKLKFSLVNEPIKTAVLFSIVTTILAFWCFYLAQTELTNPETANALDTEGYYELLFWGGGHVLQISYTITLLVVWLWLSSLLGCRPLLGERLLFALFLITLIIALPSPGAYWQFDITSFEHLDFFTQQMRLGGGIAAFVVCLFLIFSYIKRDFYKRAPKHIMRSLTFSLLLFVTGGLLGFVIEGSNAVIPAHYHGSIVGVTLAFMGLTYYLLPEMGYAKIQGRMAGLQPVFYGGGQLLHITGLAWSGGYGALRKTPGAVQSMEGQIGMGLMGLGGLLSVIGGLLFVIVAYKSILNSNNSKKGIR